MENQMLVLKYAQGYLTPQSATITITEGTGTTGELGASEDIFNLFGNLSDEPIAREGDIAVQAVYDTNANEFMFMVEGTYSQDDITSVAPSDGPTLLTSNAANVATLPHPITNTMVTLWIWAPQTPPVSWDGSGTSTIAVAWPGPVPASSPTTLTVTENINDNDGSIGGGLPFFGDPTNGSITSERVGADNAKVLRASYNSAGTEFTISVAGSRAQNYISTVTPSDGPSLDTSAATVVVNPLAINLNTTDYTWTTPKPSSWDGTGTSTVIVTW